MPLTVNKGEWSEFYVLLKLLTDQKLYAADEHLNRLADKFYPVLSVIAGKGTDSEVNYEIHESDDLVTITVQPDIEKYYIKPSEIRPKIQIIFDRIKSGSQNTESVKIKRGSFSVREAQPLLDGLHITKIKAGSAQKADIFVKLHDFATGIKPEIGFSIKSEVGAAPTLLNPSGATNFEFKVVGADITVEEINSIEGRSKIRDRIKYIESRGCSLEFIGAKSATFDNNLRKIDSLLPEMIAKLLIAYYSGKGPKLVDLCKYIEQEYSVVPTALQINPDFYSYKLKDLLQTVGLGMMPSKPWNGILEANGGYIIVRQDGEVVCYHLYNLEQFRNYLYDNTKLETGSTTKFKFGLAYRVDNDVHINLNLQIRFNS